jgi:hypothetical protein
MRTIAEIEAELKAAIRAKELRERSLHDSVKPVWRYTLEPGPIEGYNPLWDDTLGWYVLAGHVDNVDELIAVGWSAREFSRGSMRYLFNTSTGKIVMHSGGGTMYISSGWSTADSLEAEQRAIAKVGAFLVAHPEGGDITEIVNAFKKETKRG